MPRLIAVLVLAAIAGGFKLAAHAATTAPARGVCNVLCTLALATGCMVVLNAITARNKA
jgi:hypothetical protein